MTTKAQTHKNAELYTARILIENEISTIPGTERGIDLVTRDDKTILVRSVSNEVAIPLMNGTLDTLKATHLVIITGMSTKYSRKVYMMTMNEAKRLANNNPYRNNGRDNYFITPELYRYYQDDYSIFK